MKNSHGCLPLNRVSPLSEAQWEIRFTVAIIRYYATLDLPNRTLKEDSRQKIVRQLMPLGVVAAIVPWNFPNDGQLSGSDLAALAENTRHVIWGEFVGSAPTQSDKPWVIIRAVDSTFYEIDSDDEAVLNKISSTYKDVRTGEAPITSWLLDHGDE